MDRFSRDLIACQTSIGNIRVSPDGRYAAWTVTRPNLEDDCYSYFLHAADLTTRRTFPLTNGGSESGFCWLDESRVLFESLRKDADRKKAEDGEPLSVFYTIDVNGGEAVEAFRLPLRGASPLYAARGKVILSAVHDLDLPDYAGLDEEGKAQYRKTVTERRKFSEGDERGYRFDGKGYVNRQRRRLYVCDMSDGKLTPLSDPEVNTGETALSEDGKLLAACGEVRGKCDEVTTHSLVLYNLDTLEERVLSANTGCTIESVVLFGSRVFFWGFPGPDGYFKSELAWRSVGMEDGKREELPQEGYTVTSSYTSDATRLPGATVSAADGSLYFLRYRRRVSRVWKMNADGAMEPVTDPDLKVNFFDVRCGRLVCIGFDRFGLLEVFLIEDGHRTRLTDYTSDLRYEPVPPEEMSFTNSDGIEIDGWVVRPRNEGGRIPAILMIHGGPHSEYSDILLHDAQYFAAKGYAVMTCNPRGSIGRGPQFADLVGRYGTIDWDDLREFTDHVLACCPDIDPERLGVTGASYGGYMTNWIITHDNRFKAAVSQCCVSNWYTMFYVSDIPYFVKGEMGGSPQEAPEEYRRASPITYVDQARTPTLFLQYDSDYRCPIDQGLQMFGGLQTAQVESRIVIFSGDSHTMIITGKPSSRLRRYREMTDWFDRYLNDGKKSSV